MVYPSIKEGDIFKKGDWEPRYSWSSFLNNEIPMKYIIQYWDTAFTNTKDSNFSSCMTMGYTMEERLLILDVTNDRLEFPELLHKLKVKYIEYRPQVVLVEDRASGQSLIQTITAEHFAIPVLGVKYSDDLASKEARAHQTTGFISSNRVQLPDADLPWINPFINQCADFPNGTQDDMVDTLTGSILYIVDKEVLELENELLTNGDEIHYDALEGAESLDPILEIHTGEIPNDAGYFDPIADHYGL